MRYDVAVGALMANNITVEILGRIGEAQIGEMIRTVTLGYAVLVQGQLNEDKPPPPGPGSMKFKSEKQRRFVMANISRGNITVPYKRGTGSTLKGSEALNRSYRVDLQGDEVVLASAASYAPYVVGDGLRCNVGRLHSFSIACATSALRLPLLCMVSTACADVVHRPLCMSAC